MLGIGPAGTPVAGRLRALDQGPIKLGGGRLVPKTDDAPSKPIAADDEALARAFDAYRSETGMIRRLEEKNYPVHIRDDGSFIALGVLPGTYTMTFWVGDDSARPVAAREVVVPRLDVRYTDTPLDVGAVVVVVKPLNAKP